MLHYRDLDSCLPDINITKSLLDILKSGSYDLFYAYIVINLFNL